MKFLAFCRKRSFVSVVFLAFVLIVSACTSDTEGDDEESVTTESSTEDEAASSEETLDKAFENSEFISFKRNVTCEFEEPQGDISIECGSLTVPQNWDKPDTEKQFTLHTAVIKTDKTPEDATPIVYLEGGPGGDALGTLQYSYPETWEDINDAHPIIFYSQRGSKFSSAELACEEVADLTFELLAEVDTEEEINDKFIDAFDGCVERLKKEEEIDFSTFSSEDSAHDVNALVSILGYDSVNLVGISYGTRLAQSIMRLHPEHVDAVLLDSVMPTVPEESISLVPQSAERAFDELFAGCEADAVCAESFPNLEERFFALYEEMQEDPITFTVDLPAIGIEDQEVVWSGDDLIGATFSSLYNPILFAAVPQMVNEIEKGNYQIPKKLVGLELFNMQFMALGMNKTVLCHDTMNFIDEEEFVDGYSNDVRINESLGGTEESYASEIELCDLLDTGSADKEEIELVESAIPTLLFAGAYDPITPPAFAKSVAEGLENSSYVEFPHLGHAALGDDCSNSIALSFFADAALPVDDSCVKGMDTPPWDPTQSFKNIELGENAEGILTGDFKIKMPEGWGNLQGEYSPSDGSLGNTVALIPIGKTGERSFTQITAFFEIQVEDLDSLQIGDEEWMHKEGKSEEGEFYGAYINEDSGSALVYVSSPGSRDSLLADLIPKMLETVE